MAACRLQVAGLPRGPHPSRQRRRNRRRCSSPALEGPGDGGASPLACPSSAVAPPAGTGTWRGGMRQEGARAMHGTWPPPPACPPLGPPTKEHQLGGAEVSIRSGDGGQRVAAPAPIRQRGSERGHRMRGRHSVVWPAAAAARGGGKRALAWAPGCRRLWGRAAAAGGEGGGERAALDRIRRRVKSAGGRHSPRRALPWVLAAPPSGPRHAGSSWECCRPLCCSGSQRRPGQPPCCCRRAGRSVQSSWELWRAALPTNNAARKVVLNEGSPAAASGRRDHCSGARELGKGDATPGRAMAMPVLRTLGGGRGGEAGLSSLTACLP